MGLATGVAWELFKEPSFVSQKILIDGKLNFLGKNHSGCLQCGSGSGRGFEITRTFF